MKTFFLSKKVIFWLFLGILTLISFSTSYAGSVNDYFIAVKNDRAGIVKELLQAGLNPNITESIRGDTALILALRENSMEVLQILLEDKRTDIETTAFNGDNALMIACYNGNEEAVKMLLGKGANTNKAGWSPLHYAAANGNNKIVQMLLDKEAFIDAESPNETTPIMMAARNGHIYTVKLLHDNGADPSMKNQRGYSAIDFANENRNIDIAKGLKFQIEKSETIEKQKKILPKFPF